MSSSNASGGGQDFLGRGFSFPPRFTKGGEEVEMVSNAADIEQSIRILLGTMRGERVMRESFGCDLAGLLFEEADNLLISRIQRTITDAIVEHEPRVTLDRVDVNEGDRLEGRFDVSVVYTIRATNSRFNLVFPFYLTEASIPVT
ncbi:MAG TPA: GPW/gp25 family protein [Polyangium sp.]|nr:GPW/gp25 family protein [Polyangium sp.]